MITQEQAETEEETATDLVSVKYKIEVCVIYFFRVRSGGPARQTHRSKPDPKCSLQTWGDWCYSHLCHADMEGQHKWSHTHVICHRGL